MADYLKFDEKNGMAYATAPKGLKAAVMHKCLFKHMYNNKVVDEKNFTVTMAMDATKPNPVNPSGPVCRINPDIKDATFKPGQYEKFPTVVMGTPHKPTYDLKACVGSKFLMSCAPMADYLKFDESNGVAYATAPKGLKTAVVHKCLFKQTHNGKLAGEKAFKLTMSVDPNAKPTPPTAGKVCNIQLKSIPKTMKAGIKGVAHVISSTEGS
jgi:hypothetical protein